MKHLISLTGMFTAAMLCSSVLFCSQSILDPTSNAGQDILRRHNPDLTDFSRNFKVARTKLALQGAGSFVPSDPAGKIRHPSVHITSDSLFVGVWAHERSTIYLEFSGTALVEQLKLIHDSLNYRLDSIQFLYPLDSTKRALASAISAGFVPLRKHIEPMQEIVVQHPRLALRRSHIAGDTNLFFYDVSMLTYDSLSKKSNITGYSVLDTIFYGTDTIDSVVVTLDTAKPIFNNIALSLELRQGLAPVLRNKQASPAIRIFYTVTDTVADTTRALTADISPRYADYTVHPYGVNTSGFDSRLFTSSGTGRINYLGIDMHRIRELMADSATGAQFQNVQQLKFILPLDSARGLLNSLAFRVSFDTLLYQKHTLPFTLKTTEQQIATDSLGAPEVDSCVLVVDSINTLIAQAGDTAYLYLLPAAATFQRIFWQLSPTDSILCEAVFSNPR